MPISLLYFTLASLVPYRSHHHLGGYFYFSTQISVHRNAKIRKLFTLVILTVLYEAVHLICLYLCPCTSPADYFRQADIFSLVLASLPLLHLLASLAALQAAYNLTMLYFSPQPRVNSLLRSLLVDQQTDHFFIFGNRQQITRFTKWFRLCSANFYSISLVLGNFLFLVFLKSAKKTFIFSINHSSFIHCTRSSLSLFLRLLWRSLRSNLSSSISFF